MRVVRRKRFWLLETILMTFEALLKWTRLILTVVLLFIAIRWTTVYTDVINIKKSWRKVYYKIEFAEGRRRGYPDWAVRGYQIVKGHF